VLYPQQLQQIPNVSTQQNTPLLQAPMQTQGQPTYVSSPDTQTIRPMVGGRMPQYGTYPTGTYSQQGQPTEVVTPGYPSHAYHVSAQTQFMQNGMQQFTPNYGNMNYPPRNSQYPPVYVVQQGVVPPGNFGNNVVIAPQMNSSTSQSHQIQTPPRQQQQHMFPPMPANVHTPQPPIIQQQQAQPEAPSPKKRTAIKLTDPNTGKDLMSEIISKKKAASTAKPVENPDESIKAKTAALFAAQVAEKIAGSTQPHSEAAMEAVVVKPAPEVPVENDDKVDGVPDILKGAAPKIGDEDVTVKTNEEAVNKENESSAPAGDNSDTLVDVMAATVLEEEERPVDVKPVVDVDIVDAGDQGKENVLTQVSAPDKKDDVMVSKSDVVVVKDDAIAVKDDVIIVEDDIILVKEVRVVKDEPIAVKDEPIVVEDEPIIVKDEPIVVKDDPIVVKDEPIVVKDDVISTKDEPLVVKDESVIVEDFTIVEKSDAQLPKDDVSIVAKVIDKEIDFKVENIESSSVEDKVKGEPEELINAMKDVNINCEEKLSETKKVEAKPVEVVSEPSEPLGVKKGEAVVEVETVDKVDQAQDVSEPRQVNAPTVAIPAETPEVVKEKVKDEPFEIVPVETTEAQPSQEVTAPVDKEAKETPTEKEEVKNPIVKEEPLKKEKNGKNEKNKHDKSSRKEESAVPSKKDKEVPKKEAPVKEGTKKDGVKKDSESIEKESKKKTEKKEPIKPMKDKKESSKEDAIRRFEPPFSTKAKEQQRINKESRPELLRSSSEPNKNMDQMKRSEPQRKDSTEPVINGHDESLKQSTVNPVAKKKKGKSRFKDFDAKESDMLSAFVDAPKESEKPPAPVEVTEKPPEETTWEGKESHCKGRTSEERKKW